MAGDVHILIGIWGILASGSPGGATAYCQIAGVLYLVPGVPGFVVENPLGLVPLGGNDRYLHLVLGVILCGAGVTMGTPAKATAQGALLKFLLTATWVMCTRTLRAGVIGARAFMRQSELMAAV